MYLKASFRHNPDIEDISAYYRLVESYRNENDKVCHRTLLNIGFWPEAAREQKDRVVDLLNSRYKNELALFEEPDPQILQWVNRFWNEMIEKKTIDRKALQQKLRLVKLESIKHKEAREIGTEWICAHTWNNLKLTELFEGLGWHPEPYIYTNTRTSSKNIYLPKPMSSLICRIGSCSTILPTPILKAVRERAVWLNTAGAKRSAAMQNW
jgi:hypothetical protein